MSNIIFEGIHLETVNVITLFTYVMEDINVNNVLLLNEKKNVIIQKTILQEEVQYSTINIY